jgi:hypothetical protein
VAHFRRVAIRAYRSIPKANLDLGEITVIIGASDQGKSNVVRALRDWAFNVAGTRWLTKGMSVGRTAVAIGDRYKVVFFKELTGKKSAAFYLVADAETGKKVKYEKIGRTVPHEVVALTGVRKFEVDDVSLLLNFSSSTSPSRESLGSSSRRRPGRARRSARS